MSVELDAEVSPVPGRRMTAAEYFQMPVGPPYFQLIDGELFMSPSPSFFHQDIAGNIYTIIRSWVRPRKLGKVMMAPSDVQLNDRNVYQPDVYFVRAERRGIIGSQGPIGAPDLVVEVISPSTSRLDLGVKKTTYAAAGVEEFWAVFPKSREVEIHRLNDPSNSLPARYREGETFSTVVLPGLTISVADVFEDS